jgi:hypothetical protein
MITVTVGQQARTAALTIYWEGGASSSITVTLPRLGTPWRTTDTSTVDLVRRLAEHHDDATIAGVLARQGRRTGTGLAFTKNRIADLRHPHGIPVAAARMSPRPAKVMTWSASPRPPPDSASGSPLSTGGSPTGSSSASRPNQ